MTDKPNPESPAPDSAHPPTRRFVGRTVFISGGARGQGRAEAVRFAAEGANVVVIDNCRDLESTQYPGATIEDLQQTAHRVEELGARVLARKVDVRDYPAVSAVVADAVHEFGGLDVVVSNAGMTAAARFWEIDEQHWQESIDVNLTGAFHVARATVPILIESGRGGAVVFTASVAGVRGLPLLAAYVAAKHGVVGLAKTLANELAEYRVRVNTVVPHAVATDLTVPELMPLLDEVGGTLPAMYVGALPDAASTPDDIAAAVAWLASDEARHITGIQLPVDLGRTNR